MTMIDPATGWFEIVEIPNKRADYIANVLEYTWLTRAVPWIPCISVVRDSPLTGLSEGQTTHSRHQS